VNPHAAGMRPHRVRSGTDLFSLFPLCVTVLFGSLASIGAARQSDDSCSIPSAVPVGVSLRSLAQARKILIGAALNEWALVHDNT